MKTTNLKSVLFFLLATIVFTASAGDEKVTKSYTKEFGLQDNSNIYIENRFGQVNIENWDKNSISIIIEVKVEHPNREKAEKILSVIDVEFTQNGNDISAITKIDDHIMKGWNNNIFDNSSKEFSIDWEVKMPKQANLKIYNKYGDIFINELTGKTSIELKYGNLKANKILRDNTDPLSFLQLAYGNASIEEVNWFKFDIKYSKIIITKAKAIVAISKYSKIGIDQVSSVVTESKYDTYSIGKVANFVGEGGYTTFKFTELTKKLDVTSKYGDVKIESVPASFELIKFNASYASISATIDPTASYNLEADVNYGSIKHGSGRVSRIESPTHIEVNGFVGDESNSKSKVSVIVKYGSVKL